MAHSLKKLLADILSATAAIELFASGKTRATYSADLMVRSAVERQLEIIGEALRRLETLDATLVAQISDYRRIIVFRNIIAHGYDGLDDDIIWQVVTEKLPVLAREATALLEAR